MATPFSFELVSPEKQLVTGEALDVTVPGTEGYFQVLANHAPLMSTIKPGVVEVTMSDNSSHKYVVFGGFADVSPAGCTILAESATHVDDLNRAELERRIEEAREDINDAKDEHAKMRAEDYLHQLTTLQGAILPA